MGDGDYPALLNRRTFLLGMAGLACSTITLPLRSDAAVGIFQPFKFAFITDVHLTNGRADSNELLFRESQLFLQDVVKQLNDEEDLAFTIFGGDQVQGVGREEANWNTFLDVCQGLSSTVGSEAWNSRDLKSRPH